MKNDDKQFNYNDRVGITGIPVNNNVKPLITVYRRIKYIPIRDLHRVPETKKNPTRLKPGIGSGSGLITNFFFWKNIETCLIQAFKKI